MGPVSDLDFFPSVICPGTGLWLKLRPLLTSFFSQWPISCFVEERGTSPFLSMTLVHCAWVWKSPKCQRYNSIYLGLALKKKKKWRILKIRSQNFCQSSGSSFYQIIELSADRSLKIIFENRFPCDSLLYNLEGVQTTELNCCNKPFLSSYLWLTLFFKKNKNKLMLSPISFWQ